MASSNQSAKGSPYTYVPPRKRDYECGHGKARKWCSYCQSCLKCPPRDCCIHEHEDAKFSSYKKNSVHTGRFSNKQGSRQGRISRQNPKVSIRRKVSPKSFTFDGESDEEEEVNQCSPQAAKKRSRTSETTKSIVITPKQQDNTLLPLSFQREIIEADIKRKMAQSAALDVELERKKAELADLDRRRLVAPTAEFLVSAIKNSAPTLNTKEKLRLVCSALCMSDETKAMKAVDFINQHGYIAPNARELRRANLIFTGIISALDKIICPQQPISSTFIKSELSKNKSVAAMKKLENLTLDLSLQGHSSTSRVANSLLARSYEQNAVATLLKERCENVDFNRVILVARSEIAP